LFVYVCWFPLSNMKLQSLNWWAVTYYTVVAEDRISQVL